MSIIVQNITKIYGKQKALDAVNLEIKQGEIVGLLGPNGAGKSTLMKILSCFIPPTEGSARINNLDVLENSLEVRNIIGYLPENNPLYLEMYVKEYLEFVAGIFKIKNKKQRVAEIIELTGLTIEQHKKIGMLSKGFRQRVGLAQAFIHNPDVLILDEPTSGLDPNQLIEIRNLIKEIGKTKTVLFSSHIMQEVEAICDRIIILNHGKIIADSPTRELQKLWQNKEVIKVEFKEKVDKAMLKNLSGVENVQIDGNIFKIYPKPGSDIRSVIYDFAKNNQFTLLEMKADEISLEEVFHKLTTSK